LREKYFLSVLGDAFCAFNAIEEDEEKLDDVSGEIKTKLPVVKLLLVPNLESGQGIETSVDPESNLILLSDKNHISTPNRPRKHFER
jgi:hypothetical protein